MIRQVEEMIDLSVWEMNFQIQFLVADVSASRRVVSHVVFTGFESID